MRNPSLHVTYTDLVVLLREVVGCPHPSLMATTIIDSAHRRGMQLRTRVTVKPTAKNTRNRVKKVADTVDNAAMADNFNVLLYSLRMAAKHVNPQRIEKGSKDYATLKTVADIADRFSREFYPDNLRDGLAQFIRIGLKMMGKKYAVGKFKYYAEQITEYQVACRVIDTDTRPEVSRKVFEVWREAMLEYSGIDRPPEWFGGTNMVHIIYMRDEAESYGAKYKDWIVAQFEGLDFLGVIPELTQFYGGKSYNRYETYMANKGGKKKAAASDADKEVKPPITREMEDYFKNLGD